MRIAQKSKKPNTSNRAICHQVKSIAGDLRFVPPCLITYSTQKIAVSNALIGRSRNCSDTFFAAILKRYYMICNDDRVISIIKI